MALEIAGAMSNMLPDDSWGYVHKAFCLHELKRTGEAYETLIPIATKYPKEWTVPYNLACYSCQLGRNDEAFDWLRQAIDIAGKKEIRIMALDDPDLEPMWAHIGEI
jgi:tetratricopeptide (TPR) repeat protein